MHAQTRKRELVDRLSHLGLSISCEQFHRESVVSSIYTIAAVDNIDHNPSSTTASHPFEGEGVDRNLATA